MNLEVFDRILSLIETTKEWIPSLFKGVYYPTEPILSAKILPVHPILREMGIDATGIWVKNIGSGIAYNTTAFFTYNNDCEQTGNQVFGTIVPTQEVEVMSILNKILDKKNNCLLYIFWYNNRFQKIFKKPMSVSFKIK